MDKLKKIWAFFKTSSCFVYLTLTRPAYQGIKVHMAKPKILDLIDSLDVLCDSFFFGVCLCVLKGEAIGGGCGKIVGLWGLGLYLHKVCNPPRLED